MTWIDVAWFGVGAATGVAHAFGIWRSATRIRVTTGLLGLVRLVAISLLLTASAVLGGLIPTALGWGVGFFATVTVFGLRGAVTASRPWSRGRISS